MGARRGAPPPAVASLPRLAIGSGISQTALRPSPSRPSAVSFGMAAASAKHGGHERSGRGDVVQKTVPSHVDVPVDQCG